MAAYLDISHCRSKITSAVCHQHFPPNLINMATQPVGNPRQILTQIVQQIGDLSQALMGDQLGEVNNDDLASNNMLEEEVKSIFTGCSATASPTDPAVISNEAVEAQTSSVTTAAKDNWPFHRLSPPVEMQQRLCTMQEGILTIKKLPSETGDLRVQVQHRVQHHLVGQGQVVEEQLAHSPVI